MIPIFNSVGDLTGLTIHNTTYSPEMLLTLIARLERAEGEREQARAELARQAPLVALGRAALARAAAQVAWDRAVADRLLTNSGGAAAIAARDAAEQAYQAALQAAQRGEGTCTT